MKVNIYNQSGKAAGDVEVPESVWGVKWNPDLVHQVVVSMQANARTPVAHTKDRGDVSGGGKKPWRQKGTGRARHGSNRSPIWVGGGVAHGPRNEKSYEKKINKKMRSRALMCVLSQKLREGEVMFLDTLSLAEAKTKDAKTVMTSLGAVKDFADLATRRNNCALIVTSATDEATAKSFRNFGNVTVESVQNINPVVALTYKYVVIAEPEKASEFLASRL